MSFKHSGVEWIGTIPSHWKISKIKYQTYINKQTLSDQTAEDYIIQYIDIGNVNSEGKIQELQEYKFSDAPSRARRIVKKNDLLISTVRTYLKAITSILDDVEDNMICSTGFAVLTPRETMDPLYLHYLSRSEMYIDEIVSRSTGVSYPAINASDIGALECILPPLDEQQIIGKFLHEKSSEVESIIQSKLKYIELLEQQRQSIITEAVTKGLNPNAKMKDSGVEWIGEIPEYWNVTKIKRISQIKRGASPRPIDDPKYFDENGDYAWVRIADVSKSNMYLERTKEKMSELGASLSVKREPGDIFVSIAGTVGKPCITNIKCCIHDGFVYFPNYKHNVKFLYYIFDSGEPYKGLGKMGTQLNLNTETVGMIDIPLPSEGEQTEIVTYLEETLAKHFELINTIQIQIEKLKEYRQALIYEAVTGKIDVRDMELD